MKSFLLRIIGYALVVCFLVYLCLVFIPRSYRVTPTPKREIVYYWDLPTGSKIAFSTVQGKGAKKPYPIIFLQGGPGGFITDTTIKVLSSFSESGYDVYLYDQIGSGLSARLLNIEDYTADRHKRDLEEFIKQTKAEKVILIGQSWGAILATLFLADNPAKVEKMILTGPGPIQPTNEALRDIVPPDSLNLKEPLFSNRMANERIQNIRSKTMAYLARTFGIKLASDEEADSFQTRLANQLNKAVVCDTSKALKATTGSGFYAQVMTLNSLISVKDPRPELQKSQVPVLIMNGQCDNQKWGFTKEYLDVFSNHQLVVVPGAGHSISVEQPKVYIETIRAFLNK